MHVIFHGQENQAVSAPGQAQNGAKTGGSAVRGRSAEPIVFHPVDATAIARVTLMFKFRLDSVRRHVQKVRHVSAFNENTPIEVAPYASMGLCRRM